MFNQLNKILFTLILIIPFVSTTSAKTKFIGTHKDWTAYSNKEKNGKTCFIASEPLKSSGKYNKSNRGKTYVFVTNVKNGTNHEISVVAGFYYKKNTKVKFTIDKNTTLNSTGSQTVRTQWFGNTFAMPFDNPSTFRADQRSGTTNTVLSEEASSKMFDIDFA